MATSAQIIANRSNSQASTGPVTSDGKSRVSRNAVTSGLFSSGDFVLPSEDETYTEFCCAFQTDLAPEGAIENVLAAEIIHAAWRLRRCSVIEAASEPLTINETQPSVERARSSAHRVFQRSLSELRNIQTERHLRHKLPEPDQSLGMASCREIDSFRKPSLPPAENELIEQYLNMRPPSISREQLQAAIAAKRDFAKQSQSASQSESEAQPESKAQPESAPPIPRNAPCPCGSGVKYKRCCGKDAPPVLGRAA